MLMVLLKSILGLAGLGGGIWSGYMYLSTLEAGNNLHFLVMAIVFSLAGLILLILAGRGNNINNIVEEGAPETSGGGLIIDATNRESVLERNNQITSEWLKTYETKEKMKMLKVVAAAAEEKNKPQS